MFYCPYFIDPRRQRLPDLRLLCRALKIYPLAMSCTLTVQPVNRGERFIIELKIWRGEKYHTEGEHQLAGYLKRMRLDKGYLLTYSFKKNKEIGIRAAMVDGKQLVEAIV